MKILFVIIASAVVAVLAIIVMQTIGGPLADTSPVRPAIAGAVAGITGVIVGRKRDK